MVFLKIIFKTTTTKHTNKIYNNITFVMLYYLQNK
eukprot:UN09878